MLVAMERSVRAQAPQDASRVVLVVDDDRVTRMALARRAELGGFVAVCAGTLEQAREHLQAVRFPLCLVDMYLGEGMRGTDLIAWARGMGIDTEFIVVTSSERRDDVIDALRAGAFDYVEKPVDPDALREAMSRAAQVVTLQRNAANQAEAVKRHADGLERTVRQSTERLLESWHVMNEILNAVPIGILRIDEFWSVDHVNPAAEAILGVPRERLVGPIYRTDRLSTFFEALKLAADEGRWGFATRLALEATTGRTFVKYRLVLLRPAAETFRGAVVLIEEEEPSDVDPHA